MTITLDRLHQLIEELRDQYQREEEQAILQRSMERAVQALAGKDACTRIENNLGMRLEMDANAARVLAMKRPK